ncbi:MAG TPA: hypothetical protein VMS71_07110 [Candidatus Acidoferrum sp.]|nr:hypothetical protein [Candidatus Acidoferrum sp.]
MVPAVADWVIPLFFVSAMIVLSKARVRLVHESREGYRYISSGLAVFAFIALARLYVHSGLLNHVPFVSEPLFYRLLEWIGIITGTVLMVSGISNWLPLGSASRNRRELKIKHLEFVRAIEQLTQVESRADRLLASALEQMVAQFHLQAGTVFRYSMRTRQLYQTATVAPAGIQDLPALQLTFDPDGWARYRAGVKPELAGICLGFGIAEGQPACVLPIIVDEKPAGFFFLWADSELSLEEDERLNLRIAVDVIARKIAADRNRLKIQALEERRRRIGTMSAIVNQGGRLKEILPRLASDMQALVHFDVFSLLVADDDRHTMTCYTLGKNGTLLVEKGLRTSNAGIIATAMDRGEIVVPPMGLLTGMNDQAGLQAVSECHSLLLVPMLSESRRPAMVCIGNHAPSAYGRRAIEMAEAVRTVLSQLLRDTEYRRQLAARDRRLSRLAELVATLQDAGSYAGSIQRTVDWLASVVGRSTVRALEYRRDQDRLVFKAVSEKQSIDLGDGDVIRIDVPVTSVRRAALDNARCMAGQSTEPGEADNARLVLPLCVKEETVGLIEISRKNCGESVAFSRAEVQLAATATRLLGFALTRIGDFQLSVNAATTRRQSRPVTTDSDLRTHVKSSLAGILGSIELLESRGSADSPEFERYLSIMNRSAHRLNAYVEREETALSVR